MHKADVNHDRETASSTEFVLLVGWMGCDRFLVVLLFFGHGQTTWIENKLNQAVFLLSIDCSYSLDPVEYSHYP